MVNEAIQQCDVDVRRDMWGGIVLTGGGALLPGLRERLEQVLCQGTLMLLAHDQSQCLPPHAHFEISLSQPVQAAAADIVCSHPASAEVLLSCC